MLRLARTPQCKFVVSNKRDLFDALSEIRKARGVESNQDLLSPEVKSDGENVPNVTTLMSIVVMNRFVRVNTIKCSMEEAVEYFTLEGYKYVDDSPTEWYDPDMFVDS